MVRSRSLEADEHIERAGLGDSDDALDRLEQSVRRREVQATFIKIDTRWDRLRPHSRFVALLKELHLG